ncbi:AraC-like DNA-binding protein [Chitinophaga skermanii]|uniref:AraC-like DNA-binding protein n=1 Tax=Chitinophaga skermanii TaxID=331697 RepID=A0A327QYI6_9BACT|nr:AraC family transcriptional regulator [Chitinophaga skermanii]RAJ08483.1 AraC-like DNA-binding protein [Chitinophaga skermanii]
MKVLAFTIPLAQQATVIVQEDHMPHFYDHLHEHPEIQVTYIIKGEGTLLAGNYMGSFAPGDIFWIGAHQPHIFKSDPAYFAGNKDVYIHALTFFFNPAETAKELLHLPETKQVFERIKLLQNGARILPNNADHFVAQLKNLFVQHNLPRLIVFLQLLDQILHESQLQPLSTNEANFHFSEEDGVRMNRIYQHSIRYFKQNITIAEIAGVAHMTEPAFCRYFKKRTRKTYIRFLNELRIAYACKLLKKERDRSYSMIAMESGFNNVTSFNRTFKSIMGMAPGRYQAKDRDLLL